MLSRVARVAPRVALRQVAVSYFWNRLKQFLTCFQTYNPHHNKIAYGTLAWITFVLYYGTARPYLKDELWEQKERFQAFHALWNFKNPNIKKNPKLSKIQKFFYLKNLKTW